MKNFKKKISAITLISLIITIIVLLILSGISISMITEKSGLLSKTKTSTDVTNKNQATEEMNLKITNIQISSYVENEELPSLQYLADKLCDDKDIEYVELKSKTTASLKTVNTTGYKSIYTKLKEYPYEFEINDSLQLASIDGIKIADTDNSSSQLINNITFDVKDITTHSMKIDVSVNANNSNDARIYYAFVNGEVVTGSMENIFVINNLNIDTKYNIKCACIDKNGKIKESATKEFSTASSEILYKAQTYSDLLGIFETFRVDTAPSYSAFRETNNFYEINAIDSNGRVGLNSSKKIKLDNVNYIELDGGFCNNYGSRLMGTTYLGICTDKDNTLNFTKVESISTNATSEERKTIKLDVSDINGEYYIKIVGYHPSNVSYYQYSSRIYSLLLEK